MAWLRHLLPNGLRLGCCKRTLQRRQSPADHGTFDWGVSR